MKKVNIKKSFISTCLTISIIIIVTTIITFLLVFINNSERTDYKKAKVLVNEAVCFIEDNYGEINKPISESELNQILKNRSIQVIILNLNGVILYNSKTVSQKQESEIVNIKYINLEELHNVNYISPIVISGEVVGNSVFSIPKQQLVFNKQREIFYYFIPLILGIFICIIILLKIYLFTRTYILKPINELNTFTHSLSKGKYKNKLKYDIDSEVTTLCTGFELMQEELQYSLQQQRNLEKERKELIACISHDLKTPLASIKAYVGAIKDGFAKDTLTLEKYVQIIDDKADNILKLVNDFFEHSKAELGELRINKTPQYSKDFFGKVIEAYRIEFHRRGIEFIIDTDIPQALINIDELRLEQVIFNLFQNAMKYCAFGGKVNFGVDMHKDLLQVYIKDTGRGISNMDLPYIFDKFYRGEKERPAEYEEGAGLGLYICKYIVEALGGQLYAESKIGVGTTFYFTIPKL